MMLSYAFKFRSSTEGVYIHARADSKLFNLVRLRAKIKVSHVVIREMHFADDVALVSHTMEDLHQLMNIVSHAREEFGLTINIKKTKDISQSSSINQHCQ